MNTKVNFISAEQVYTGAPYVVFGKRIHDVKLKVHFASGLNITINRSKLKKLKFGKEMEQFNKIWLILQENNEGNFFNYFNDHPEEYPNYDYAFHRNEYFEDTYINNLIELGNHIEQHCRLEQSPTGKSTVLVFNS
jgi:hypothetical protein